MVTFSITHQISSSKGWGRYSASVDGTPVVQSSTGNAWVSAGHSADVVDGTVIVVTLQSQESTKNGKKNTQTDTYRIVAKNGSSAILGFWNGLEVTVSGAEVA
jgi:hypothetical protein